MEQLREEFEWYANWAADVSLLYEPIARDVADTEELLAIADLREQLAGYSRDRTMHWFSGEEVQNESIRPTGTCSSLERRRQKPTSSDTDPIGDGYGGSPTRDRFRPAM